MTHHSELRSFLTAVRRRWFAHEALCIIGRAAAAACVPAAVALLLFFVLRPEGLALVTLGAIATLASIGAAAAVAVRMQRRPSDLQVARFVEERALRLPERVQFDDALVTAVDARSASDPAFGELLAAAAAARIKDVSAEALVTPTSIRRMGLQAAAGLIALVTILALGSGAMIDATHAAWVAFFPASIAVDVLPGDARVVAGQPLQIRAAIRADDRVLSRLAPTLTVSAGTEQRTVPMAREGQAFVFQFESVDRTFRYHVTAGKARSAEHTVTALLAPRVERIELQYRYPAFSGLSPRQEDDGGDIYAPAGTRVRLRVHADKPLAAGLLTLGEGPAKPLIAGDEGVFETELVLSQDNSYRIELADQDGLTSAGDTEYFIRLMEDRPPDVRILRPGGDQKVTALEEVTIEARAEDDHGIASLELVYMTPGGRAQVVPFARASGPATSRLGAHLLEIESLKVQPGDVISYYARARDVGRGKRASETRSDMYFLEVRPFGEEFVAAQSQSGGGGGGGDIETLIAAQKEIINATWTIERRAGTGRSARDLEAVVAAQQELKARAERLATRGGRGRREYFPMRVAQSGQPARGRSSGEGVSAAIQSMGLAIEQLEGQRTRDAINHEMAALQALLRAQAEIRRREVMQQQANGASSGGAGRQGQDLSALFDKELQRQQRTNYETRSQVEERPDQKDQDPALDRIRDLARRQEELSRRQEDLARSTASAEERKRQLERLSREQQELREQVEELAKQMGGQSSGQSGRGRQGEQQGQQMSREKSGRGSQGENAQGDSAGRQLREASEQMRGAAGDLSREDAKSAADRAARAAEQLRQIEQQMRGEGPDGRQRMAGELQLEAQQLAEQQRRIASEARRLEQSGSGNEDARRRLAGEKDQLADRTDALQRAATDLASRQNESGKKDGSATHVATAARELSQQKLGQRMRDTAQQMREKGGTGAAEEQIARSLDKVVEQLGGGSAESRALSAQLDQTQQIRNRLNELERQIAQADAKAKAGAEGRGEEQGSATAELQRLREEYGKELQRSREALRSLEGAPRSGVGGATPEQHEWSQADPGKQSFKQDFSGWASLRKDIDSALERTEAAVSARLAKQNAQDRLNAGGSDRAPEAYRRLISRYYESLASIRK
jgi:hypothetical protein